MPRSVVLNEFNVRGFAVYFGLKLLWHFLLLIIGGVIGFVYWPKAVGFVAVLVSLLLLLPLLLVTLGDIWRAKEGQAQPTFFEMNMPPPRPLFTGRIANALDAVAHAASELFGVALVLGGLCLLGYNLVSVVATLVSRGAWFSVSVVVLVALAVAFQLWRSSLVTRFIAISALSILLFVSSPFIQRALQQV